MALANQLLPNILLIFPKHFFCSHFVVSCLIPTLINVFHMNDSKDWKKCLHIKTRAFCSFHSNGLKIHTLRNIDFTLI